MVPQARQGLWSSTLGGGSQDELLCPCTCSAHLGTGGRPDHGLLSPCPGVGYGGDKDVLNCHTLLSFTLAWVAKTQPSIPWHQTRTARGEVGKTSPGASLSPTPHLGGRTPSQSSSSPPNHLGLARQSPRSIPPRQGRARAMRHRDPARPRCPGGRPRGSNPRPSLPPPAALRPRPQGRAGTRQCPPAAGPAAGRGRWL